MRTLIIGDVHIEEKAIPELTGIFNEIMKIDADRIIQLGDFFHHNRPTPLELKFATRLVAGYKEKYKDVIILSGTGEHDFYHDYSVVEYLEELGAKIVRGDYIDNNILYGHFMLYESKLEYGTGKCGIKNLAKYKYVFLGHQHNPQDITNNIFHVGSVRYRNFNEVNDEFKRVAMLENDNLRFMALQSPYPMLDVHSVKELSNIEPGKKKVRLVISAFEQFKKEVNEISKWRHKFNEFKVKLNFSNIPTKETKKAIKQFKKLKDILIEGISKIKDKDVRKLLEGVIE